MFNLIRKLKKMDYVMFCRPVTLPSGNNLEAHEVEFMNSRTGKSFIHISTNFHDSVVQAGKLAMNYEKGKTKS